jgi:hypothetical protein
MQATGTPWIIWVVLVGAIVVATYGFRAYFDHRNER